MAKPDGQAGKNDTAENQDSTPPDAAVQPKGVGRAINRDEHTKSTGESNHGYQSASDAQKETLDAIRKGERIALWIAAIVALGTIGQWITTSCNNADTSTQTGKLIKSAQMSAHAADHNAASAQSFAESASSINKGIADAVRCDGLHHQGKSKGECDLVSLPHSFLRFHASASTSALTRAAQVNPSQTSRAIVSISIIWPTLLRPCTS